MTSRSLFDRVGGMEFFDELTRRFYEGIATDAVLLPLYPEPEDLEPARVRLAYFLAQYWGGPDTYSQHRGHPRLRMRHAPYRIGERERDHWLTHMVAAVEASDAGDDERQELLAYFVTAAEHLRNDDSMRLVDPGP